MIWPLEDEIGKSGNLIKKAEFHEFSVSTKAITRMAVSKDLNYLFTASEDGSVFVLSLTEVKMGVDQKRLKDTGTRFSKAPLAFNYDMT